jgi:hypothetical protein
MKKKLAALIFAALLVFAFAACSADGESESGLGFGNIPDLGDLSGSIDDMFNDRLGEIGDILGDFDSFPDDFFSGGDSGEAELGDFQWEDNDTGVTITVYTGRAEHVVIPDTLGGRPVTVLGESSFSNNRNMKTVEIPTSVTLIGHNAFSHSGLTSVVIPDSVTDFHTAFTYCRDLVSIEIPASITKIPHNAFIYCQSLTSITLNEGLKRIYDAFEGCAELKSVDIPDSVTFIRYAAFASSGIESVTFEGVTYEYHGEAMHSFDFNDDDNFYIIFNNIMMDRGIFEF